VIRAISRLAAAGAASMMILAVAPSAAPANTPAASIQFAGQAQLQENGSVNVTVHYLCQPGIFGTGGFVGVELQQPGVARLGLEDAKCDDQKHKVTINVSPSSGSFSRGSAAAKAFVENDSGSSFVEKLAEITIK
jgi:hypothetical protein